MTAITKTGQRRAVAMALVLALAASVSAQEPEIAVVVKEGEGALNNIRTLRAKEPVVLVQDSSERPVKGATVTFLLPELGASGVFPSGTSLIVTTGEDGLAVGKGLKPNNVVGDVEIRVVASYQGQTARTVIHQTNAAPKASSAGGKKTAVLLAVIGGVGAAVAVGVTRGGGSSSTPSNPGASISAGGTTFGPPR